MMILGLFGVLFLACVLAPFYGVDTRRAELLRQR